MFNATLDSTVRHRQQSGYADTSFFGGVLLPGFFQTQQRRIVQIVSGSQLPFALYTERATPHDAVAFAAAAQHWQSFYIMTGKSTDAGLGVLRVLYGTQAADNGYFVGGQAFTVSDLDFTTGVTKNASNIHYTPFFESAHVLFEVQKQIKKRHYKGANTTVQGGFAAMRLQGFSLLNNLKRVEIPGTKMYADRTEHVHILLSHVQDNTDILQQENNALHDQVLSLVRVNMSAANAVASVVQLLSIVTHEPTYTPHSVLFSIIPHDMRADTPNNIAAKSIVAIMVQRGNTHTVHLSNFSCLQCGEDLYDATTESCNCRAGTLPVCLPCSTNCATGRFVVDPNPLLCHKADLATSAVAPGAGGSEPQQHRRRHNLARMPCTGTFFCTDGTVTGLQQCPSIRPLTMKLRASAGYECSCAAGLAYSSALREAYAVDGGSISRVVDWVQANISVCESCSDSQLCTPLYTQESHRIQCPEHTSAKTTHVPIGGTRPELWSQTAPLNGDNDRFHNVYQGCLCDDGYYRAQHKSDSYLMDRTDFIYKYAWKNSLLSEQAARGNTRIHTRIEICRASEAGWVCQGSLRQQCPAVSSYSAARSTHCTCRPGFVRVDNTTCGLCPPDSLCPGGNDLPVLCNSATANEMHRFCPCAPGSIRNAVRGRCETCPPNFYCPGFANMTGVPPSSTIYARQCPDNTTSLAASQTINQCFCGKGSFLLHRDTSPTCVPCDTGYYCPGFGHSRAACPPRTTTAGEQSRASAVTDCVCLDPTMQLQPVQLQLQQPLGPPDAQQCVCRAGWLQSRYTTHCCLLARCYVEAGAIACVGCRVALVVDTDDAIMLAFCVCVWGGGWVCFTSPTLCVRCNGFPANSTFMPRTSTCSCSPGHFATTPANIQALNDVWYKSSVAEHPLSADYREITRLMAVKYGASRWNDGVLAETACAPCPPNLVCAGNNNPPVSASAMLDTRNITSLFYGVLPVGASSAKWWVPCPTVRDTQQAQRHRALRHSISMSSCFRVSSVWSPQNTRLPRLASSSFPALMLVHTCNTSLITAVVNVDQSIFSNYMHASAAKTPTMQLLDNTDLGDSVWLVSLEMDTIHVVSRFTEVLESKQEELLLALHVIDQSTGVAYSTLVPLLWACAVRQETPPEMGEPIFIVPGVAHSTITQRIAVRTIAAVMQILGIGGLAPRHIFQVSSRQIAETVSFQEAYTNPLYFMHNNVCDSYYSMGGGMDVDVNCDVQFAGTLLSSYTSTVLAQIKLTPSEDNIAANSNSLQQYLGIDGTTALSPSSRFLCPRHTLTERIRIQDGATAKDLQRCRTCTDSEFWHENQCLGCETNQNACEEYSAAARSRPCSWTQDLLCELL